MANQAHLHKLASLAVALGRVEAVLERSFSRGHAEPRCDEWCKLWMMLAGAWYSLNWAVHCLTEKGLHEDLKEAHRFALDFLTENHIENPTILTKSAVNPWFTGYFLVSAEHRIANTLDRLITLFFFPSIQTPNKKTRNPDGLGGFQAKCKKLLQECPHCHDRSRHYLVEVCHIVEAFAEQPSRKDTHAYEGWRAKLELATVWDRANNIKHNAAPDKTAVSTASTIKRWEETADALGDLVLLMEVLATHWQEDRERNLRGSTSVNAEI